MLRASPPLWSPPSLSGRCLGGCCGWWSALWGHWRPRGDKKSVPGCRHDRRASMLICLPVPALHKQRVQTKPTSEQGSSGATPSRTSKSKLNKTKKSGSPCLHTLFCLHECSWFVSLLSFSRKTLSCLWCFKGLIFFLSPFGKRPCSVKLSSKTFHQNNGLSCLNVEAVLLYGAIFMPHNGLQVGKHRQTDEKIVTIF